MTTERGIVLVVDDEPAIGELAVHFLEKNGYRAYAARSGAQALDIFRRHSCKVILLVTDMVMPDLFGDQLASQMREMKPDLRVLFMSGNIPEALEAGVELEEGRNFLHKPFRMSELVAIVERCLEERLEKNGKEK